MEEMVRSRECETGRIISVPEISHVITGIMDCVLWAAPKALADKKPVLEFSCDCHRRVLYLLARFLTERRNDKGGSRRGHRLWWIFVFSPLSPFR